MKLLHLYPNLMNMYGDYANILALKKHLEDQGLTVEVDYKDINEDINFSLYDFIYMGSGTESKQLIALNDIIKYKDEFNKLVNNNKVILFTGNASELLGNSIDDNNALNVFDFKTQHIDKRYTGDVIVYNDEIGELVGFVNKSSIISGDKEHKLFKYIFKDNNLNDEEYEGYIKNNTFATELIGPILLKNPNFMKYIVKKLLPNDFNYIDKEYKYELASYNVTLNALKERIK